MENDSFPGLDLLAILGLKVWLWSVSVLEMPDFVYGLTLKA